MSATADLVKLLLPVSAPDEFGVWRADLDVPADLQEGVAALLSSEEKERAARLLRADDRNRFIVRRGLLRVLLASHTGLDPARIRFAYGRNGKPEIAEPVPPTPLSTLGEGTQSEADSVWIKGKRLLSGPPSPGVGRGDGGEGWLEQTNFSVSSSGGVALYAVSDSVAVGVDLERLNASLPVEELARDYLADSERSALSRLTKSERPAAFLTFWTRKEACAKALGPGLAAPFTKWDVSGPAGVDGWILVSGQEGIRVRDLYLGDGFRAALAAVT